MLGTLIYFGRIKACVNDMSRKTTAADGKAVTGPVLHPKNGNSSILPTVTFTATSSYTTTLTPAPNRLTSSPTACCTGTHHEFLQDEAAHTP